jgi:hypothetical protein
MSTSRKIQERFQELVEQSTRLVCRTLVDGSLWYEADGWRRWATSAEHIIESVFGSASVHARHFAVEYGRCHGREAQVHSMRGILRAAKDDYESGYAIAFTSRISGGNCSGTRVQGSGFREDSGDSPPSALPQGGISRAKAV